MTEKKGVCGGTMVSPALNRQDALVVWKDSAPAAAASEPT